MGKQALEFLEKHPETFSSDLERSREIIEILKIEISNFTEAEKKEEAKISQ